MLCGCCACGGWKGWGSLEGGKKRAGWKATTRERELEVNKGEQEDKRVKSGRTNRGKRT